MLSDENIVINESERVCVWECILYPESLKKDWLEILESLGVSALLSPLHSKDTFNIDVVKNGETIHKKGDTKKEHYHLLLKFGSKKSFKQIKEFCNNIQNGNTMVQQKHSIRGAIRYLCHLDNDDKFKYNIKELKSINGFEFENYLNENGSSERQIIKQMIAFIQEYDFKEPFQFINYCLDKNEDWFIILKNNQSIFKMFFDSYRNAKKKSLEND